MKKLVARTDIIELVKVLAHKQKKKLVVRFAYTPDPFMIKVKSDVKKGEPLVISTKSSKSVSVPSSVNQLGREVPSYDPLTILDVKGQPPQCFSGIGYHTNTRSNLYSLNA